MLGGTLTLIYMLAAAPIIFIMWFLVLIIYGLILDKMNRKLIYNNMNLYIKYNVKKEKEELEIISIIPIIIMILGGIVTIIGVVLLSLQNPQNFAEIYNKLPFWFILKIIALFIMGLGMGILFAFWIDEDYFEFKIFVEESKSKIMLVK